MAEVYRARDTTLGRDVAIKILPDAFTADPDRLARFEREARVLAALNHPNIATIHGVEESDGVRGIVMELVEGETLAERIQRGPLPIAEALNIARQIAEALEAAHEKGIVHRDLKPANIKITADWRRQGARLRSGEDRAVPSSGRRSSQSPTVTSDGTREGVIVGTAAVHEPRAGARAGRSTSAPTSGRSACVLYEMLTGRRAFAGETVSDTIAAILEREPDWNALPDGTPMASAGCCNGVSIRIRERRLRDIGDARMELEETLSASRASPTPTTAQGSPVWRTTSWYVAAAAVLSALIAAFAAWNLKPAPATAPESQGRFTLPMPAGVGLHFGTTVPK